MKQTQHSPSIEKFQSMEVVMLGDREAVANLAVKNLNASKRFYEDILGLVPVEEMDGEVVVYKSGNSAINVYRSEYAGTNQATAVTWDVGDEIENVIQDLKEKGVTFEHYNMPGITVQGDLHVTGDGGMKVAWFKDPDGNILNLISAP